MTLYVVAHKNKKDIIPKGQTIKLDRILFQQPLVQKIQDEMLIWKKHLSPELTPLSLADMAGNLRSINKTALGKILENRVTVQSGH